MASLSDRLEALVTEFNGACCPTCDEFNEKTIREAVAIIKRYEEAPVVATDDDGLLFVTLLPGERFRLFREPTRRDG